MLKAIFADKEILRSISLIGRLGLNIVLALLLFFLPSVYIESKLNSGNIILIAGTIIGIFSGVYLNYRHLKKYYEDGHNKPPTV